MNKIDKSFLNATNKLFTLLGLTIIFSVVLVSAVDCSHYASPNGTGDGLSQETPFLIADFWNIVAPGNALCLIDGIYKGADSMINPPSGLSGTKDLPITIIALHDGQVEIDAESVEKRRPVHLQGNDYFILEGFNAHSSGINSLSVIELNDGSDYNIVRRVIAWDNAYANGKIFSIHFSEHNLIEDCAGWGNARKIFSNSLAGNYVTFRRCFGMWEKLETPWNGPKMVFSIAYDSYHGTCENCIATWDSDYPFEERHISLLGSDGMNTDRSYVDTTYTDAKYLGSIGYLSADEEIAGLVGGIFHKPNRMQGYEIKDSIAYVDINAHPNIKTFSLNGKVDHDIFLTSVTAIGTEKYIHSNWTINNFYESPSTSELREDNKSVLLPDGAGAKVCYRYEERELTDIPLWPWPMDSRIKDARKQYSGESLNITEKIESLFGPIPDECKTQITSANCGQGKIITTCLCQGILRDSGFCCENIYQSNSCEEENESKGIIDSGNNNPPIIEENKTETNKNQTIIPDIQNDVKKNLNQKESTIFFIVMIILLLLIGLVTYLVLNLLKKRITRK